MYSIPLPLPAKQKLREEYDKNKSAYLQLVEELVKIIRKSLADVRKEPGFKYRLKSFDSYYKKLVDKSREKATYNKLYIPDLLGIRIICPFLEDLNDVENILKSVFTIEEIERKGSEYRFHEFWYESVHFLIRVPAEIGERLKLQDPPPCEIQVRTILQDAWAEVEHELTYKSDFSPFDVPLKRKLAALNANLHLSDIIFQEIREYQRRLSEELNKRRDSFWSMVQTQDRKRQGTHINKTGGHSDRAQRSTDKAELAGGQTEKTTAEVTEAKGSNGEGQPTFAKPATDNSIDSLLLDALTAHNEKRFDEAIDLYSGILKKKPDAKIASIIYVHRGMAYFAKEDYENALRDFTSSLKADPENYRALNFHGFVLKIQDREEEALADFSQSIEKNPYQFEPYFARAEILFSQGQPKEALRDCESALSFDPESRKAKELYERVRNAFGDNTTLT